MKGFGLSIFIFFATVATSVFAQDVFRLDVTNKPLSQVLIMLDVEISFDAEAMAAYQVTASRSFNSKEDALAWLLENKPYRIEKIGAVYVIVPADSKTNEMEIPTPYRATERFIFKGTVVDHDTREPLEYATVSLLTADGSPITTGITANDGRFCLATPRFPQKIKISHIGYETLLTDLANRSQEELGDFLLQETTVALQETVVTARERRQLNRTVYDITPEMQNGATNALALLDRIPDIHLDRSSETLTLNQQLNILLLIDGVQHTQAYLKHISPRRVQAVEVVHSLSGRFLSDDYSGIIHLKLKKDYSGYDIHASTTAAYNLTKANDYNRLTGNHPSFGITYSANRFNFFGTYAYDADRWNMRADKKTAFINQEHESQSLLLVSAPAERPNDWFDSENNTITAGVNYQISPRQQIGIQSDYMYGNAYSRQTYYMRYNDIMPNDNSMYPFVHETDILRQDNMYTGLVFYQGQLGNRLRLYGDFACNYYYNRIKNNYQNKAVDYQEEKDYIEYKNHTVFNLESKYILSDKVMAELGYSNIWRRYSSESFIRNGFLDYQETGHKIFAYLSYYPTNKLNFSLGVAIGNTTTKNKTNTYNFQHLLPNIQFRYRINRAANLCAGYAANPAYPALYQLSPMTLVIDTFMTQIGNPALRPAVRHQAYVELSLWNRLRITPQYKYVRDDFSEAYEQSDYKLYRTFQNVNVREYSLQATYDQMLGQYFRLKNAVLLYRLEAQQAGVSNSLNGWTLRSEINYYHSKAAVGIQAGYYRNMRQNIILQGYQTSDKDYWLLSLQKELWRNRVSLQLSYIPPIPLGVRYDRAKEITTPFYQEQTVQHIDSYKQMLLLKISVRFEQGRIQPVEKRTVIKKEER